jgi:hypothetical protein
MTKKWRPLSKYNLFTECLGIAKDIFLYENKPSKFRGIGKSTTTTSSSVSNLLKISSKMVKEDRSGRKNSIGEPSYTEIL